MTRGAGPPTPGQGRVRQRRPSCAVGRWRAHVLRAGGQARAPLQARRRRFTTKRAARQWLTPRVAGRRSGPRWSRLPPADQQAPRAGDADAGSPTRTLWLAHRDLKDRTRAHDRYLLDCDICPRQLGRLADRVHHRRRCPGSARRVGPRHADDARALLRAAAHDHGDRGHRRKDRCQACRDPRRRQRAPCRHHPTGQPRRAHQSHRRDAAPVRAMILLASWCALRFGELTELRRRDVDVDDGVIRVRRAVARLPRRRLDGRSPEVSAGRGRDRGDAAPMPVIATTLPSNRARRGRAAVSRARRVPVARDAVRALVPGTGAAGRPDLPFHDCGTPAQRWRRREGASLAELMARLGHPGGPPRCAISTWPAAATARSPRRSRNSPTRGRTRGE